MKNYEMKITDENIKKSIENNCINRNKKLERLMQLLNTIDTNAIISIDGGWGTGKTVFVKQLEYMSKHEEFVSIDKDIISEFKKKFDVYYYNAWENDMYESVILSLIYNLINDFPTLKKQSSSEKIKLPFNFNDLIKTISVNFVDLKEVTSYEDLSKEIHTAKEQKEALDRILDSIIPQDKKLIFIVDELDRCNPSFAVKLLETLKHYFDNEKLIFIMATNNEQLSHTVEKYYGDNFDGYGYLSKFYDLIIELDSVDAKTYLGEVCKVRNNGHWWYTGLLGVIQYFNFNMREINRILSDFDLLTGYFDSFYAEDEILKYVFLPYCLALKIRSKNELSLFLTGQGLQNFLSFSTTEKEIIKIIQTYMGEKENQTEYTNEELKDFITEKYDNYFKNIRENTRYYDSDIRKKNDFLDAFSLLSQW